MEEKIQQNGENSEELTIMVLTQDCHCHLQNVWTEAVKKPLSSYLNEVLASDLSNIDF